MENIKTFVGTFAAGAAIAAASLLTVAAPASAATQAAAQQAGTATTALQQRQQGARPVTVPKRHAPPLPAEEQREQHLQRGKTQKQAGQQQAKQPAQSTDPGQFLPDPPVVTPEG
ncbi:MAG: hypothetical protein QOC76_2296 [Mycobacterium sp.]|nr:hypothetical protein [Mycobacterium sp.]